MPIPNQLFHKPSKPFNAKFTSTCPYCGYPQRAGTPVCYIAKNTVVHTGCAQGIYRARATRHRNCTELDCPHVPGFDPALGPPN